MDIFREFSLSGGGAPFSDPAGSFNAPAVHFATSFGYDWRPFGLQDYGALITGILIVPQTGEYTFGLDSDDGSLLYIDGALNVDNGGPHGPQFVSGSPLNLIQGVRYTFQIEFFECCGGPGGVDLYVKTPGADNFILVPSSYHVPEPGTLALLGGIGAFGLAALIRRRKR